MSYDEQSNTSSFPECTPDQYERVRSFAEPAFAAAGHKSGEQIPVIIDGEIRIYSYLGSASASANEPIPNCPIDFCRSLQPTIERYCHSAGFPPNTPIPVLYDDSVCYCYCR